MDLIPPDTEWTSCLLTGRPVEFKLLDDAAEAGVIEGYGATFGGVDYGDDTILPGAFTESLAKHHAAGTAPALLWHHRMNEPIGKITAAGEDARGLRIRGKLNQNTEGGRKAYDHIRHGDVSGLSIGFQVAPGGSTYAKARRTLSKLMLHEVSAVTTPMDHNARITGVKSLASRAELEDLLRETGLARGAAKKIAAGGWPALSGDPVPNDDPTMRALLKALDTHLLDLKGLAR